MDKLAKAAAAIMSYLQYGIYNKAMLNNLVVRVDRFDNGGELLDSNGWYHEQGIFGAYTLGEFVKEDATTASFELRKKCVHSTVLSQSDDRQIDSEYYQLQSVVEEDNVYHLTYEVVGYRKLGMVGVKVEKGLQVQWEQHVGLQVLENSRGYWVVDTDRTKELQAE